MKVRERSIADAAPERRASLFAALAFLLLGGLAVAVPFVPHVDAGALSASILGSLGVLAIIRQRQGRFDVFEVYLVVGGIYFVYFGVGTMYHIAHPEEMFSLSLKAYLRPALGLAVLGWFCFTAGYATLFRHALPSPAGTLVVADLRAILIAAVVGFLGSTGTVLQESFLWSSGEVSGVLSAVQQAAPLFFFAWALAWCLFWNGQIRGADRVVVFGTLVPLALAIVYLQVGAKLLTITMAGIPIIAYWYARRRLPKFSLVAVLLLTVLVIFPIYNTFRLQNRQLETTARLERAFDVASGWNAETFYDRSVGSFIKRMAIVTSVAAVLRDTGRTVDFKNGETLLLAPISLLIPRVLWPGKPKINIGREFGEKFHLVNAVDRHTQIAPSILGELYWNFSFSAVVLGMFLFGGGFRWVYQRYAARTTLEPVSKAIYVALLTFLVQIEGNVAALIGGVVKTILLFWIFVALMQFLGFLRRAGPRKGLPASAGH